MDEAQMFERLVVRLAAEQDRFFATDEVASKRPARVIDTQGGTVFTGTDEACYYWMVRNNVRALLAEMRTMPADLCALVVRDLDQGPDKEPLVEADAGDVKRLGEVIIDAILAQAPK